MNTVLVNNIRFPECSRWHAGKLWFADYFPNQVMHVDPQGAVQTIEAVPVDVPGAGLP